MSRPTLDWYALAREAAPGVLLGAEGKGEPIERAVPAPTGRVGDIWVGFETGSNSASKEPPCIALVSPSRTNDLFAWLHTFSGESFPISQFCRVETTADWDGLLESHQATSNFDGAGWASAIAGEMLANGEQNFELKTVPLSWALGCFSFTMARVVRLSGKGGDWTKLAATRLRILEADARFVRRKLTVDMLSPIWAILASGESLQSLGLGGAVAMVLTAVDADAADLVSKNTKLLSNSAEQRIHGFDEVVDRVMTSRAGTDDRELQSSAIGVTLAAAALIAGNGTSHVELLRPYVGQFPECLPWFGLIAGLAGPVAWDSDWLRIVKGVERQIRSGFRWTDPLQGDLCWVEFDWLRQLTKSPAIFIDLPKHHSRLLTVEVVAGATFQIRLGAAHQNESGNRRGEVDGKISLHAAEVTRPSANEEAPIEPNQSTVAMASDGLYAKLRGLAAELSDLASAMERSSPSRTDDKQHVLFEGGQTKPTKRAGPAKAARKPRS